MKTVRHISFGHLHLLSPKSDTLLFFFPTSLKTSSLFCRWKTHFSFAGPAHFKNPLSFAVPSRWKNSLLLAGSARVRTDLYFIP